MYQDIRALTSSRPDCLQLFAEPLVRAVVPLTDVMAIASKLVDPPEILKTMAEPTVLLEVSSVARQPGIK